MGVKFMQSESQLVLQHHIEAAAAACQYRWKQQGDEAAATAAGSAAYFKTLMLSEGEDEEAASISSPHQHAMHAHIHHTKPLLITSLVVHGAHNNSNILPHNNINKLPSNATHPSPSSPIHSPNIAANATSPICLQSKPSPIIISPLKKLGRAASHIEVGNLLHIGQHEACHSWKHGGYFNTLLEGEEASISSHLDMHAEDTKPLIMRSLEINGAHNILQHNIDNINKLPTNASHSSPIQINNSPNVANATSPNCIESKPSPIIISPLKRGREVSHNEGGGGKREKKGSSEEKGKKGGGEAGRKASSVKTKVPKSAPLEPPRTDYVHVRARRGQATDSHSLAERVRREKISERMRFLQDLVPGCSKITGKALILDEIINYVQSLQNQVEFLAMRLAAINPKLEDASLSNSTDEKTASPFVEGVRDSIDMLPKAITTHNPTSDLQFDNLPTFYLGLFDDSNFNSSIVSDLSTSTCNDSNLTSMDFSHLG